MAIKYISTMNFVHNIGKRGLPFKKGDELTGLTKEEYEKYFNAGWATKEDEEDSATKVMAQPSTRQKATKVRNN